jgi:hypothetical protein
LGLCGHLYAGNPSALAPLVSGTDLLIFLGKGADRDIVYLVGFPPLCYWVFDRLVVHKMDNQTT